jgi:hypothetical protein
MRIRTALQEFDWKGWSGWMMATMAGVQLVVVIIFFYFAAKLDNHWWGDLGMVSAAGISLGVCQWIWLRRRLVKGSWWIVSTLLGWYLASFLIKVFDMDFSNATGALARLVVIIKLLAIPLAFSLPQWFLIRRQFRKAAGWWIVARPLAWLTGAGLVVLGVWLDILPISGLFLSTTYDVSDLVVLSTVAATFGVGFAAVTGAAFTWIQTNQTVVRNHGD